jgi:dienelactone hydrolase
MAILVSVIAAGCGSSGDENHQSVSALVTKEITYSGGGVTMKGYLAYNDSIEGQRPGVIVVHEFWGLNDHARRSADRLAEMGYLAFALDMFGEGKVADHPDDARAFTRAVSSDFEVAKVRFNAALDVLKSDRHANPDKIAAIGYCFGGGIVLNMARHGADLDAVASFHGNLRPANPPGPASIKARILVLNGAADSLVSQESIDAFKAEMDSAGVDYEFINYPNAKHAFTNPDADSAAKEFGLKVAYNEPADRQSWARLTTFLRETFGE